jgi:acetylornithine/N-succinyldiaminopimelate aminotransferase
LPVLTIISAHSSTETEEPELLLHDDSPAAVEARDRNYVLGTYARAPFHPRSGRGALLTDAAGAEYWDLLGGIAVSALGYEHPRLVRTLQDAASSLLHVSNLFYDPAPGILAESLVKASGLSRVFFCNSGTEANEAALKIARLVHTDRHEVVALHGSFHGRTFGSLSVTGNAKYRQPFEPLLDGVTFIAPNDLEALERAVTARTAAIILEPILGEGGVIPLSIEYLQKASLLAETTGALLICDEIQTGLGRCGTMFAYEAAGILPDLVTLAKPLGGGLPLGAVLVGPRAAGAMKPGMHGTTFGGNPLACRLGIALLQELRDSRLVDRVNQLGAWLGEELAQLRDEEIGVIEIRGRGLMWGIELDRPAGPLVDQLRQRGFITGTAGEKVLRLLPPYVIPQAALKAFLSTLRAILHAEPASDTGRFPAQTPHHQAGLSGPEQVAAASWQPGSSPAFPVFDKYS